MTKILPSDPNSQDSLPLRPFRGLGGFFHGDGTAVCSTLPGRQASLAISHGMKGRRASRYTRSKISSCLLRNRRPSPYSPASTIISAKPSHLIP